MVLDRPEKLNALTASMIVDLRAAVAAAVADREIAAIVVTGTGRAFCAGQDLGERRRASPAAPPDLGESLGERYNPLVRALAGSPKPVVVAVNGVAAGAGADLALAGHVVVAASSARFVWSFARVGLLPDSGGTWTLPRSLGRSRALPLALLAGTLDAEAAHGVGLVWRVVSDDRLLDEAVAVARRAGRICADAGRPGD